jgi:hypothetical protein
MGSGGLILIGVGANYDLRFFAPRLWTGINSLLSYEVVL